ncbi:MAG: hemerythrin domain-containing protein [Bacteroidota bacterium]
MKRHVALVRLSREHHTALVLAKHAMNLDLASDEAVAAFTRRLGVLVEAEIEPHFCREEVALLPLLAAKQTAETPLVQRTLDEHRNLRELVASIQAGDRVAIPAFGRALEAHVHFEERTLFPVAESVLSPAELAELPGRYAPASS